MICCVPPSYLPGSQFSAQPRAIAEFWSP